MWVLIRYFDGWGNTSTLTHRLEVKNLLLNHFGEVEDDLAVEEERTVS